jgi:hypothetical protein
VREARIGEQNRTLVPVLFQPAALPTPTPAVHALRLATWTGDASEELDPLLEAVKQKVGHGVLPDVTAAEDRARMWPVIDRISRVAVAQAALDYCALALQHELRRQAGYLFKEADFQRTRESHDRLKVMLSGPGMTTEDDFHELLDRFMSTLHPDKPAS